MSQSAHTSVAGARLANVSAALLVGAWADAPSAPAAVPGTGSRAAWQQTTRAARLLTTLFCEVGVLTEDGEAAGERLAGAPMSTIEPRPGPASGLAGLVAALEAAREERVLVLAADLAHVTPDLLLALTAWPEAPVVAPRANGRCQPLCAIYRKNEVLPLARELWRDGDADLHALLGQLECGHLEGADLAALDSDIGVMRRGDVSP